MLSNERLEEARKKKGLSQHELAKLAAVSQPAISLFISGKKQPSTETLEILADILEVTTDYLLGRD